MFNKFEGEQKEALINNLLSYAATTQNKTVEDLASIFVKEDETLNEDALNVLLTNHSNHVKSLQGDTAEKFDSGYSKGKKEALVQAEKALKAKFGIASDAKIEDLVDEIVSNQVSAVKETFESKQITDVDVQNHELYKSLLSNVDKVKTEYETQISEIQRSFAKAETDKLVSSYSDAIIAKLNPVFDADPQRAANQKAFLTSQICSTNWTMQDGKPMLVDDKGLFIKNEQGFAIDPEDFIKGVVLKYHSLHANSDHNSITGQGNNGGNQVKGMPKNSLEYIQMLKSATREDKLKLKDYARKQAWYNT